MGIAGNQIEQTVEEILQKIKKSMNGVIASQMNKNGIIYQKNYGVTIPRLKEIAAQYESQHELAQKLWEFPIRETKILATLLEPAEKFSYSMAQQWMEECTQIELIEQICMNLFSRLSYASQLCCEWISSENDWKKIAGFILSSRISNTLTSEEKNFITEKAFENSTTENYHLYKAISICLSRFCHTSKETTEEILQQIESFFDPLSTSQHYIKDSVEQELNFLELL